MSTKRNYYFLHGFLGSSDFFADMMRNLKSRIDTENVYSYSLFSKDINPKLSPKNSFLDWSSNFNSLVKRQSENNILIAYSMGGRLGIHTFLQEPDLWNDVHLISSNPGIIKSSQKMVRMAWEDGWCYQIDNKPWDEFIRLWNAQDIFKFSVENHPEESQFSKDNLKLALKNWSLTKHKVDLGKIKNSKLNWYVGENDDKYNRIHKELRQIYDVENINIVMCKGHRISEISI